MLPSSAASSSGVRQGLFGGRVSLADNLTSLSRLYRYHFTARRSLKTTQTVSHSLKSLTNFAQKRKNSPNFGEKQAEKFLKILKELFSKSSLSRPPQRSELPLCFETAAPRRRFGMSKISPRGRFCSFTLLQNN